MSQKIIDSDEIETIIGEIISQVTEQPVACRLELARIQDGSYYLQWHVKVLSSPVQLHHTLGLSVTIEAYDIDRLRTHIRKLAADIRVKLMALTAEGN
jgi:hypothetical protein